MRSMETNHELKTGERPIRHVAVSCPMCSWEMLMQPSETETPLFITFRCKNCGTDLLVTPETWRRYQE